MEIIKSLFRTAAHIRGFVFLVKGSIAVAPFIIVLFLSTLVLVLLIGSQESKQETQIPQGTSLVSAQVLQWRPLLTEEMNKQGLSLEWLPLVEALIQQESSGMPPDVMQSSESIGLPVGTLQPKESIHYGIQHLINVMNLANVTSVSDMDGVKLFLQAYNFGTGFIGYVNKNGGKYTKALAISFSRQQAAKLGWRSYGDVDYIEHVLRYYSTGSPSGEYVSEKAKMAVEYAMAQAGKPYIWGAVGPNGFDCSGLIIWSYKKAGYAIQGRPTTKTMQAGNSNFVGISKADMQVGDLIVFSMSNNGIADHVGIYIGNNTFFHAATDTNPLPEQIHSSQLSSWWTERIVKYVRVQ